MLKHADIWMALDRLAQDQKLTASGLARRAGLDPTTFNKSKRVTREGKPRWPSTESIAKVLEATGLSLGDFIAYLGENPQQQGSGNIPLISFSQAGGRGYFTDAGYPTGTNWDEIPFPDLTDPHAFALEITGDGFEPLYRDGDILILSPTAGTRRGDRVVLRKAGGEMLIGQLQRLTAKRIELAALAPALPGASLAIEDVAWMARILWVSQ